ncbi:hypothetical protein NQD34_016089, partial [Periophthalmus magnuspinnatus]
SALFLLNLNLINFCTSGLSITVIQPTRHIFTDPGSSIRIDCSLDRYSMSSAIMYWFRQRAYKGIERVCQEYDERTKHFQCLIDGAKNNFSVEISDLAPDDRGTYYCAAS